MANNDQESVEQPAQSHLHLSEGTAEHLDVPIFEVTFKKGMWLSIPKDMSQQMYEKYKNNEDVGYTWDWGDSRVGSWELDGEVTSINRYVIDFNTWEQRNLDDNRRRSVRLVWVAAEKVDAICTGKIPDTGAT